MQITQPAGLQILNGVGGGLNAQRLIGGELLRRHAGLLRRAEQRHHAPALLGKLDLLAGGDHAVHDAAHLVGQLDVQRLDVAIDIHQPRPESLEQAGKLNARRPALEEVGFKTAGELLVMVAALFKVEALPFRQVAQAKPTHQRLGVGNHLALAG
ncbi:MAG: hypothetical protein BWY57_03341 [Betaproteobacteria bacterium ADurb.Bin341]|nr:MAG: hypothetical protein BWY57_03341 [Betaproteobacteria bacterium ADurb.Bin341]